MGLLKKKINASPCTQLLCPHCAPLPPAGEEVTQDASGAEKEGNQLAAQE